MAAAHSMAPNTSMRRNDALPISTCVVAESLAGKNQERHDGNKAQRQVNIKKIQRQRVDAVTRPLTSGPCSASQPPMAGPSRLEMP